MSGSVSVVIGLADEPAVHDAACTARLNGSPATACADVECPLNRYGAKTVRALRFDFSLDAARDGSNTAVLESAGGTPRQIIWAELDFPP